MTIRRDAQNARGRVSKSKRVTKQNKPRKIGQAEKAKRINDIHSLLLAGARRFEIVQYGSKNWRITDRQIDDYIADANAIINIEASKSRDEHYLEHVAIRRDIRKRAHATGDTNIELRAAQDEATLLDLYPAKRHKHEFENVSDADIIKQARELALAIAETERGDTAARVDIDERRAPAVDAAPESTAAAG